VARSRPSSRPQRPTGPRIKAAGEISGAVAAIVGLVVLVVGLLPAHHGESGTRSATPPRLLDVRIQGAQVDADVTYRNFLRSVHRTGAYLRSARKQQLPPAGIHEQLAVRGVAIDFELQIYGPAGRRLELTPTVYHEHGRITAIVPRIAPHHTEHYVSEARRDLGSATTWAPYPTAPGAYYVDLRVDEIKGAEHVFVRSAHTKTFHVPAR
jgi:hypothetical protein